MADCQPNIPTHNTAGSTQTSRLLGALKTDFVKLDERSIEDLIIATNKLSEHLNYYNPNNVILGNWSSFFQWESTSILAQISTLDTAQFLTDLKLKKRALLFEPNDNSRRKLIVDFFKSIQNTFQNLENKIAHISNDIQFKEYLKATAPSIHILFETIVNRLEFPTEAEDIDDVRYTLQHHLFNKKIQNAFGLLNDWKEKSGIQLKENLKSYASHAPQYALYLAFLKLFGIAQDDLNNFTQRHLDFYYKKILHLTAENAKPDHVHLYVEPFKNQASFLVEQDTIFAAGKDKEGRNKYYKSLVDTAINQAKISNLFGAAIGNNDNYFFEDLIKKNASGESFKSFPKVNSASQLGVAIASPLFFLRGGTRNITITFNCASEIDMAHYNFYLTGEEEWLELSPEEVADNAILFRISPDEKAIIPFDAELHEGAKLKTLFPVLKIVTKEGKLHELNFQSIEIKVKVTDYKQFKIFTDAGEIDHTKSFQPFGAIPKKGNAMVFSCNEFFQKKGAQGNFIMETDGSDWYASSNTKLAKLIDGKWGTKIDWKPLKFSRPNQAPFNLINEDIPTSYDFLDNPLFTSEQSKGFAKIIFNNSNYTKESYLQNYLVAAKAAAVNSKLLKTKSDKSRMGISQNLPYIPTIYGMSFNYEVTETIKLGTSIGTAENKFNSFHLYPSGFKKLKVLTKRIIPEIDHNVPEIDQKGAFYIGLKDATPGNAINLLIQVAEGTANPRQHMVNLKWFYLNGDDWMLFDDGKIIEGTHNLTQSGIVQFAVPKTINLAEQTQFDPEIFWVKIVLPKGINNALDAVCNILGVHAQALEAILFDFEKSGLQFTENLEAETISKLYKPKNEIKSITQPYASFGGKIKETDPLFYQRVSERLRHKDRAITIWDYEKLILDNFPKVFRVKCLNHFRYDKRESENIGEIANTGAGYVTIIPVAKASTNQVNTSWKPLVDLGTMAQIKSFLEKKASPHVRINVKTPQLEKLELTFNVAFKDLLGGDEILYKKQLQDAINKYLSPWAYDNDFEVNFQTEIEKSELIQLIEKQSFVDYISDFVVEHHTLQKNSENIDSSKTKKVANKIIPNTPYSLFIAHKHDIITIESCCL